jgi:hypothetical protein
MHLDQALPTYHLGVKLGLYNGRIAAMVLGRSRIKNAHLPPKPPSHLDLEGRELEVATVSVNAQGLGDADDQSTQGPNLARIVISPQQDEEYDKSLKDDDFVAIQKVGARQSLLQTKAVPIEQDSTILAPSLNALLFRCTCHGAVVYGEQQRFQPLGHFVQMRHGLEKDGLESRHVQDLDQRVDVFFVRGPILVRLVFAGMQRLHVDIGGTVSEDEALVVGRVVG